jgi:hypothetical protein
MTGNDWCEFFKMMAIGTIGIVLIVLFVSIVAVFLMIIFSALMRIFGGLNGLFVVQTLIQY